MTPQEIWLVKERLQAIKLTDAESNRKLYEIDELSNAFFFRGLFYAKIEQLKRAVEKGEFIPIIPDYKLHDAFEGIMPHRIRRRNQFFAYAYMLAALVMTIAAFIFSNYWLLSAFPIAFISFAYLSGIIAGRRYALIAGLASILLISLGNTTFGVLFLLHVFSIWCGLGIRWHRRLCLIQMAFADDEIFWFLFSANVLSLYDTRINTNLYKGCEVPEADLYAGRT